VGSGWDVHESAFRASSIPTLVVDLTGVIHDANAAYAEMSGRSIEALVGAASTPFIHVDDLATVIAGMEALLGGAPRVVNRRRHRRADGSWLALTVATTMLERGGDDDALALVEVLDHHPAVDVDGEAEERARFLLQAPGDAGCFHDGDGRIVLATANLADLLGYATDELRGRRLTDAAFGPVLPGGDPAGPDDDPVVRALATGEDANGTLGIRSALGEVTWVAIRATAVPGSTVPARSSLRDITELVHAQEEARRLAAVVEEQLAHVADHDDLTGLKTRRIASEAVDAALRNGEPVSVVFVDLDGFKSVNDRLGHLAGDDFLVAVAARLRQLAGPDVTVARAGGDEFVAVTGDAAAAESLVAAVRRASAGSGGVATRHGEALRASAGAAHAQPGDTRSSLFARADAAMYADKRGDRGAGRPSRR
jgi:diguanylate cyclase (GGDEF)-like protein/PAS domain S-box-containing protein